MKFRLSIICMIAAASFGAHAETANPDLSHYQCYKVDTVGLHITQEDAFAGRGFPAFLRNRRQRQNESPIQALSFGLLGR